MNPTLFLSCFFVYVIAMIAFGTLMAGRKQKGEDFLLGGRSLPLFLTLGTTLATMVGTGSSMGAVGKAYAGGWMGSMYGIGGAIGILLVAWLFAPARRHRFLSMAEELSSYVGADRRVSNVVGVLTFFACVGWLGLHILGGGTYLAFATGIEPWLAKTVIAAGFGFYAIIGGYRSVVWTDTLQGMVLFVGFIATAVVSFSALGGWDGMQAANARIVAAGDGPRLLPAVSLIAVIAVGVLGTPAYRQRVYSGNSVGEIRRAFVISGLLYFCFAALPTVIGLAAYNAHPGLDNADEAFPSMAMHTLPLFLGMLVLLAGLSATMSSASSDAMAGVTTVIRDLYRMVTGRMPSPAGVVRLSRVALSLTVALALVMALRADGIIGYIGSIITLLMTGMCVCGLLGRLWPRFNANGALAAILAATGTALPIMFNESWSEYRGNPVLPSLAVSLLAGVVVSLITPPDERTQQEALELLEREREEMAAG